MRFILLVYILIMPSILKAQDSEQYIVGGRFYGLIQQANHINYAKDFFRLESDITIDILKSYKLRDQKNHPSIITDNLNRLNGFYYGWDISFSGYWANTMQLNMVDFTVGPNLLIKYYTPVNLFLQGAAGLEYRRFLVKGIPSAALIYIPTSHFFGYSTELFMGYSLQLPGNALLEPSISYKLVRSHIYFPNSTEVLFNPKNSLNFHLGIFFIIN